MLVWTSIVWLLETAQKNPCRVSGWFVRFITSSSQQIKFLAKHWEKNIEKWEKKGDWQMLKNMTHHCGRSDHYVTLVWSSDLKRSNGSEGTNTQRLPAIAVCGRVQELICRACTRLFTRGLSRALLCYRYLSESSTSFAKKLFPTVSLALRGKS
jgi:hypothetical protein